MRSFELYYDTKFTEVVENLSNVRTGDAIGLFMKDKQDDLMHAHIGAAIVNEGKIHLLHGAKHNGQVVLEQLADVLRNEKYSGIGWVKRPIKRGPVIAPAAKGFS
jgi:hypothetical protein